MSPRFNDSQNSAKSYALRLLGYRPRSRKELKDRLGRKGFNDEHINSVIESLENAGFISDEILARELFRGAVERKYFGKKGVEQLLLKRGIEKEIVNECVSALTREIEEEAAARLVEKKLKTLKNYPEDVVKRRLWSTLQRRGFPPDIIKTAVNSIEEES